MLTKVVMSGIAVPRTFLLEGVDPDADIILKSVSGLTPGDVTLFTGDYAGNGGYYQGRRFGGRNVVFNFKLNPVYGGSNPRSVSSLREELYSIFYQPTYYQENLHVSFYDDDYPDQPRGLDVYADKYQGDIFSQDTSVQISTQCVDSFLTGQHVSYFPPGGGVLQIPITYRGTAPTGIQLTLGCNVDGTQWVIDYFGQKMTWQGSYQAGDIFGINTVEGNYYINHWRYPPVGAPILLTDGLGGLTASSQWLTQSKGTSTLRTYANVVGDGKTNIQFYGYDEKWLGL